MVSAAIRERFAELGQAGVAYGMAISVVVKLEVIDVDHQKRQFALVLLAFIHSKSSRLWSRAVAAMAKRSSQATGRRDVLHHAHPRWPVDATRKARHRLRPAVRRGRSPTKSPSWPERSVQAANRPASRAGSISNG